MSIDTISPEQFTIDELEPLQSYFPSDAIDYFTIDPAKKKLYLEQAIAEGSLSGQVFSDCNSFSTIEHKHNRYELKRAQEILKMLWEVSKHAGKDDIGSKISLALAQDSVTMAALIEACAKLRNETGATAELKDFYLGCLDEAQAELYTPPKKEVANRILAMLRVKVENLEENALTHNAREIISAFKSDYPFSFIDRGAEPFCSPMSDERVSEFSAEMHRRYDGIFKQLKEEYGDLTNDLIPEVTNRYLELRGIRTQNFENGEISGWNCQYDERVGGFKNQPKLNTLLCGKFAVSISWQRFEELMMHEVEGHVIRAYNPKSRGHEALAYGLPRNEDAEEGWGLIREQLWRGKISSTLSRDHFRYLAIAYGEGTVDGQRHSKEETFDFISRFMITSRLCDTTIESPVDVEATIKRQRKLAFEHVFRAFRGMPEDRVYFKDTSYLVGKMNILQFLASTEASASTVLDFMDQGKFDPNNPLHIEILKNLGFDYFV